MARNFLPTPFAAYKGVYTSLPFNAARGQPKGLMVAVPVDWYRYNVVADGDFNVVFDLNGAGPNSVSQNWTIQSVYIDNEGVDFPVYVHFPQTGFTVSAPANSAGWYQVYTNDRRAWVIGLGIPSSAISSEQATRVFFTDTVMTPALDQEVQSALNLWLGSTSIPYTGTPFPGFGPPALGDQMLFTQFSYPAPSVQLPQLQRPGNWIYLTHVQAVLTGFQNNGGTASLVQSFRTTFAGDLFVASAVGGQAGPSLENPSTIINLQGNIKLDGDAPTFQLVAITNLNILQSTINWTMVYSIHPK